MIFILSLLTKTKSKSNFWLWLSHHIILHLLTHLWLTILNCYLTHSTVTSSSHNHHRYILNIFPNCQLPYININFSWHCWPAVKKLHQFYSTTDINNPFCWPEESACFLTFATWCLVSYNRIPSVSSSHCFCRSLSLFLHDITFLGERMYSELGLEGSSYCFCTRLCRGRFDTFLPM